MNIFLIPSWYPSKENPVAGRFIKEQVLKIAEFNKNTQIAISLWGDDSTKINFEHPGKVFSHLSNFIQDKPYQRKIAPRVFEFSNPALEWSARLLKGNINSIIRANIINFLQAQKKLGKIDLIHAHISFPAGFVAKKLSEKFKIPYIVTEHMGPFPLAPFAKSKKLLPLVIEPLKKADKVIAISSRLKDELQKYQIKSIIIPDLVDENQFKLILRANSQKFILFALGDITPEKGFEDLIRTLAIVFKKENNLILRIGGTGKYLKQYQHLATTLKINQSIVWLKYLSRSQVIQEMQKCNAFILPSHHESFGLVFLEALFSGKPVITTRCGGPEDLITKDNGILVDIGRPDLLSGAIIKIKNNIKSYNPVKIRSQILKKFSSKIISKKIAQLYKKVI